MTGNIIGWAHSQIGRLEDETVESLVVEVARGALEDAGGDVGEIVLGH